MFVVVLSRAIYPGLPRTWGSLMVSGTHTIPNIFRDSYGSGMGIVWGREGVPLLGVPENPTVFRCVCFM